MAPRNTQYAIRSAFICYLLVCGGICKTLAQHSSSIHSSDTGLVFTKKNGSKVVLTNYSNYRDLPKGPLITVRHKSSYWGLANTEGEIILEPVSRWPIEVDKNHIEIRSTGSGAFVLDTFGKIIAKSERGISSLSNGWIAHEDSSGWGVLDPTGILRIPHIYQKIEYHFQEGLFIVKKGNKYGAIDSSNNVVIPFDYYDLSTSSEGLINASIDGNKYGYINHKNEMVIPPIYDWPGGYFKYGHFELSKSNFHNKIAVVQRDGHWGVIDNQGNIKIPIVYHNLNPYYTGYAAYIKCSNPTHSKYSYDYKVVSRGYIDGSGKEFPSPMLYVNREEVNISKAPKNIPDSSHLLKGSQQKEPITMEWMLSNALMAFEGEPANYPDLDNINQICAGYSLMLGGGNFGERYRYDRNGWETFKHKTLFTIIGNEEMRSATWSWISPYFKSAFQRLHPFVQKTYKSLAKYLKNYINNYNKEAVKNFLQTDEANFAFHDLSGNPDPNRKLSAFVDRLILVHKVIDVNDAKKWINKIADEVDEW